LGAPWNHETIKYFKTLSTPNLQLGTEKTSESAKVTGAAKVDLSNLTNTDSGVDSEADPRVEDVDPRNGDKADQVKDKDVSKEPIQNKTAQSKVSEVSDPEGIALQSGGNEGAQLLKGNKPAIASDNPETRTDNNIVMGET
jgi:hypothetical protein